MKRILLDFAVVALLAVPASNAAAQSQPQTQTGEQIVIPLGDPERPATLEVSVIMASISVTGYDGDEITIVARDEDADEDDDPAPRGNPDEGGDDERGDRAGLRRIPNTSIGLTAEQLDNTVTVVLDPRRGDVHLDISVPRSTSVRARTVNGGDLTVADVAGEHELSNVNGDISATNVRGSVVANTTNGDVEVSLIELTPDKAMSFTSFNGDVEVTLPADLAADLLIDAGRGDVLTDFDFEVQTVPPVIDRSEAGGRYRVRLEREVRALVGGGGPEMHFKTFNGDIVIRRQ